VNIVEQSVRFKPELAHLRQYTWFQLAEYNAQAADLDANDRKAAMPWWGLIRWVGTALSNPLRSGQ
jgi:hypothetical protein